MTLNGVSDVPDSVLVDSSPTEATNEDIQLLEAPYVQMSFNSFEEAKKYYKEYGRQQGFETRVRSADKRQSHVDVPSSGLLVCSHEGIHNKKEDMPIGVSGTSKNTSTVRCDCRARMRLAKKKLDNIYTVTLVENNHSYGLVSPYKRGSMRSNKSMPEAAKNLTEIFDNEGLLVAKVASVFSGDAIGLTSKMCQNYSATRKKPKENDVTVVLDYFKQKSAENPQFYYAVQLDPSGTAVNFFWIEGRSRVQYEYFALETLYLSTWLAAMGGRPPTSILTDQDRAMTGAIAKVEEARNYYKIVEEEVDRNGNGTYFLKSRKPKNTNVWKVSFDITTLEVECECKYFKFMGISCAHLLKIFLRYDVEEIPTHFILKRWTQKANTYRVVFDGGLVNGHGNQEALRVSHCIKVATQLAYDAATNVESYTFFIEKMSELTIGVAKCKETLTEGATKEGVTNEKRKVDVEEGRNKRIKSDRETTQEEKNGRLCKTCQKIAKHDSRNCPDRIQNATFSEQHD